MGAFGRLTNEWSEFVRGKNGLRSERTHAKKDHMVIYALRPAFTEIFARVYTSRYIFEYQIIVIDALNIHVTRGQKYTPSN